MSAKEYREYAAECMDWARTAKSDQERDTFLQMAQTWLNAALVAEGRLGQTGSAGNSASKKGDMPQEPRAD
jgi:hypothetical protein